jgi:hypothetical protein
MPGHSILRSPFPMHTDAIARQVRFLKYANLFLACQKPVIPQLSKSSTYMVVEAIVVVEAIIAVDSEVVVAAPLGLRDF